MFNFYFIEDELNKLREELEQSQLRIGMCSELSFYFQFKKLMIFDLNRLKFRLFGW